MIFESGVISTHNYTVFLFSPPWRWPHEWSKHVGGYWHRITFITPNVFISPSVCSVLLTNARNMECINRLTPNDPYMGRNAPLTSKRCILYIYSTNKGTKYFKHALYSPFFFLLQNAVCFIMLTYLVPVLFTFYIRGVLKLKNNNSGAKGLNWQTAIFYENQDYLFHFLCICLRNLKFFEGSKSYFFSI